MVIRCDNCAREHEWSIRGGTLKVQRVYAYTPEGAQRSLVAAGVGSVPAGFPSPSPDYSATQIDLPTLLIRHEVSSFAGRVSCDSVEGAEMCDGGELIGIGSIQA